jgi:hypothetical protein
MATHELHALRSQRVDHATTCLRRLPYYRHGIARDAGVEHGPLKARLQAFGSTNARWNAVVVRGFAGLWLDTLQRMV